MADMSKYQDINNIGNWPWPGKIVVIVLVMLTVFGLGYYFFTSDQLQELESKQRVEQDRLTEFENKYKKAANLELYRQQMEDMQGIFNDLLERLPKSTEIPGLLDEISYAASGAGVDLISHSYQNEVPKEFYMEKPIAIAAIGSFHQIADFVSRISGLPRIVTIHDFKIEPAKDVNRRAGEDSGEEILSFTVLAKTYRYEPKDLEGGS
ncbi:MAG: type 4a pilus biogenesis protein PilO [Gammaproteobacteria bacterium]|nr:type 4a pilus biogenesis protein PilO [Gammaproteobacteria bacterium]